MIAATLAKAVLKAEGGHYKQLLGGGLSALNAEINLKFTVVASAGREDPDDSGTLEEIAEYYRRLKTGRMVITGAVDATGAEDSGTGKTVLAIALILGLAQNRAEGERVPVRLSATSWPHTDVRTWLAAHLVAGFGLSRRDAWLVVDADLVLPVIDGLDEIDGVETPVWASRAARLLREVEEFECAGAKAPVVLSCRRRQYEALGDVDAQPQVGVHVEIGRIDREGICLYLQHRVCYSPRNRARWQQVLDALEAPGSSAVAQALNSPWQLTLAVTVFEERLNGFGPFLRNPADLISLAGSGRLHEYLLDRYIRAAVNALPTARLRTRYTPEQVRAWLAELATYLNHNSATGRVVDGRPLSGTEIALHELWPLAGSRLPRIVHASLVATAGLAGGAVMLSQPQVPIELPSAANPAERLLLIVVLSLLVVGSAFRAWKAIWPEPKRLDLRLRTPARRILAAAGLTIGLGGCLVSGLAYGPSVGLGFVGAGVMYCTGAVAFGDPGAVFESVAPRDVVRNDLTFGLIAGPVLALPFGFAAKLATGIEVMFDLGRPFGLATALAVALDLGLAFALATVLAYGLVAVLTLPCAGMRYAALLICTRQWNHHQLPWRLGRLLHWCYGAGLLRIAGTAYQFRHRELQEHLAPHTHLP